jgi:hypothetical protein
MSETTEDTANMVANIDERRVAPTVMAAIGSIALALYYCVRGEKQRGRFVGLWPATIIGLATYIKLDEIKQLLQDQSE